MSKCDLTDCLHECADRFYRSDIDWYEKCTAMCREECLAFAWARPPRLPLAGHYSLEPRAGQAARNGPQDSAREGWVAARASVGSRGALIAAGVAAALALLAFLVYWFYLRARKGY